MNVDWIGCAPTNFRRGRRGHRPNAIVVHIIVGSLGSADNSFLDPRHGTSAHYGVGRRGAIHQYVREEDTAFHAGIVVRPAWPLIQPRLDAVRHLNPNLYTIGIEHEGHPDDEWPSEQYDASARLIADVAGRWNISIDDRHVIPHRDIRASKSCPGRVDLARLIAQAGALPSSNALGSLRLKLSKRANIRSEPARTGARLATLDAGIELDAEDVIRTGEIVDGISAWYRLSTRQPAGVPVTGGFVWAGAVEGPPPGGNFG